MPQETSKLSHAPDILKGSLFAIIAFFFMAVFGVFTKVACATGNFIWVSFLTYLTATILTTCLILPKGMSALQSQHYPYLVARAMIGTMASFLYMYSMRYISIVNSTLLFNTAPIFIPIIMTVVLKIHEPKKIWLAVFIGFIGILAIIKPGEDIFTNPGNLIGLLSGLSLAIAYLFMKFLTATETGLRIIFYYFGIGTLMQIPLLFFTHGFPELITITYSVTAGLMLMIAQIALVRAYTYAAASQVGIYQYTSIVFVALIEWLIASRVPVTSDYIGFALVTIAGVLIITSGSSATSSSKVE